jgi:hypothetical protein
MAISQSVLSATVSVLAFLLFRKDLEVGDEQQVDDVHAVIRMVDDNGPPAWRVHDELAIRDRNLPTIGEVDDKRTERLSPNLGAEFIDCHVTVLELVR